MRTSGLAAAIILLWLGTAMAGTYDLAESTVSQLRLWGAESAANLGYSLAAGDLDGDGLIDLAIGSPGYGSVSYASLRGAVYLLLSSQGLTTGEIDLAEDDADVRILGAAASFTGYALATGDWNGDGIDDLAVGAPRSEGPGGEAVLGQVFVFYGAATWAADLSTTADADVIILGEKTDGQFGAQLASGDFDGDGIADLFAAAPAYEDIDAEAAGKVYGFLGGDLAATIDLRLVEVEGDIEIVGERTAQRLGQGLALGEMNGDGYADLAVGAPGLTPPLPGDKENFSGTGYVVLGREVTSILRLDLAEDVPDSRLVWTGQLNNLGAALTIGDIDDDGIGDLLLAAPNLPAKSAAGEVFTVYGGATWPTNYELGAADITIHGAAVGEHFGLALATGDTTGDCVPDVLIGAPRLDPVGRSHAYALAGRRDFPTQLEIDLAGADLPLHTVIGAAAGDRAGYAVLLADLDDDGVRDLVVGAPTTDPSGLPARTEAGGVYVIISEAVNHAPIADAGPDRESYVNLPVVLDGTGSYDPDEARIAYTWTQASGPATATLFDEATATPVVVPTAAGTYVFELVVADCVLAGEPDEVIVEVDDYPADDDDTGGDADATGADDDDTGGADDDVSPGADDDATGGGDDDDGILGSGRGEDDGVYGGGGCTG